MENELMEEFMETELISEVADVCCGFTPELAIMLEAFILFFSSVLVLGLVTLVFIVLYKLFRIFF